jgi:hypothetical protein
MTTSINFDMQAYWEDRLATLPKRLKRQGLQLIETIEKPKPIKK